MSRLYPAQPVWAATAVVNAVWVGAGESPERIATSLDVLVSRLGDALGINRWRTSKDKPWEGTPEVLADLVRSHVVTDDRGKPEPESGYVCTLLGRGGPRAEVDVQVSAGAIAPGRRLPTHRLSIVMRQSAMGGVDSETADTLCAAVVEAWSPAMVVFSDRTVLRLARRGNWKIGVGYRLWLSSDAGAVSQLADGLTAVSLGGGTLVSAPDEWPAERVVDAMTQTLAANDLDEIPH